MLTLNNVAAVMMTNLVRLNPKKGHACKLLPMLMTNTHLLHQDFIMTSSVCCTIDTPPTPTHYNLHRLRMTGELVSCVSLWPPLPLVWALTNLMCALWCTSHCLKAWRGITRRQEELVEMDCPLNVPSCMPPETTPESGRSCSPVSALEDT